MKWKTHKLKAGRAGLLSQLKEPGHTQQDPGTGRATRGTAAYEQSQERCGCLVRSVTHVLSEKTYGTVAFVGLMPAKTWVDAEVLKRKCCYDSVSVQASAGCKWGLETSRAL